MSYLRGYTEHTFGMMYILPFLLCEHLLVVTLLLYHIIIITLVGGDFQKGRESLLPPPPPPPPPPPVCIAAVNTYHTSIVDQAHRVI